MDKTKSREERVTLSETLSTKDLTIRKSIHKVGDYSPTVSV